MVVLQRPAGIGGTLEAAGVIDVAVTVVSAIGNAELADGNNFDIRGNGELWIYNGESPLAVYAPGQWSSARISGAVTVEPRKAGPARRR